MIEPPFTGPVRQIYFDASGTDGFIGTQIIIDDTPLQNLVDRCIENSSTHGISDDRLPFSKYCSGFYERDVLKGFGTSVANYPEYKTGPAVVFMCACLCEECWDSYVTIKHTDQHVHWYNFRIGSINSTPVENFGIITFDRQQYVNECQRLKQDVFDRVTRQISEEALKLEQSHLKPEIRSSRIQLDHLLHPEYIEIGASGTTYTKAQVLDTLPEHDQPEYEILKFHGKPIDPPTPYSYFTHTTYTLQEIYPDGSSRRTLRSSIWAQDQGKWLLKFHQGTPITGP
ncbi:MAG: nuclear transport factor 2 family protein [Phycisphaerales bacterium]